jgi:hypothetical protein
MIKEMQQRALRYRQLARDICDDKARDAAVWFATECENKVRELRPPTIKLFDEI